MSLAPGERVGSYQVVRHLGSGAMASVYQVRHVQLDAVYALKLLDRTSGRQQERLLQEGRVQAGLRHPNIVSVTDVVEHDGRPGLVMEYVDGPNLAELIAARHPLDADLVDRLGRAIVKGVRAAHRQGHVHRDLKPANILVERLDDELVPKIADFGLVKVMGVAEGVTRTRTGAILGSPAYMAPEQTLSSRHVDHRADVWALGAVLYQLATNRLPFDSDDIVAVFSMVRQGAFPDPRPLRPDLPERMWRAIEGAMTVHVDRRIADCDELLAVWEGRVTPSADLGSADTFADMDLDGSLELAPPVATAEPAPAGSARRLFWIPAVLGVLLAVALGGGAVAVWAGWQLLAPGGAPHADVTEPDDDAPAEPADAPVDDAAVAPANAPATGADDAPAPGDDAPAADAPAPGTDAPAADAAPPDRPAPAPPTDEPPPTEPAPARISPAPVPGDAPATDPSEAPIADAPPPEPPPAPPEPTVAAGHFAVTGQAEAVWLVRNGTWHEPGPVEPGVYTVAARFPGRAVRPLDGISVEIAPGDRVTLDCVAGFLTCRVR